MPQLSSIAVAETDASKRVVVIGGGVSGLAAAHRLLELREAAGLRGDGNRPPPKVLLVEATGRVGGTVRTTRREGFLLEGGPDSFISEKPAVVELARRLGLSDRLIGTNDAHRRSFVVRNGQLRPTPEGFHLLAPARLWPFVTTDIFTWRGKARMALDLLLPRRTAGEEKDESLASFVRRRFGQEALERMAQPMVGGIYTADPERLSLRATMPRFLDMEREHRSLILALRRQARSQNGNHTQGASGARYGLFLSFDEGTQVLTDALAARLSPGALMLDTRVEAIQRRSGTQAGTRGLTPEHASGEQMQRERSGDLRRSGEAGTGRGGWLVRLASGETIAADAVCIALPAHAAAHLLAGLDAELAAELEAIPYASTATVNLAYKRTTIPHALDGFGFVVPYIERRATLACTFSSVKFAGRAPDGHALLRAFVGGALQPEMFALDEDEMTAAVRRDLRDLLGIEEPPLFAHVEKWPRSMAQYHLGHTGRVGRIRRRLAAHAGLALCGNAYTGAGLPDCVREGERAATDLFDYLRRS
jgi:protoporphyrinogen/coproporphyrinogen III oxidase